ncbi:hypothetical protein L2725_06575 [Shewanella corallii]|uniref:PH domain-containing protein n=1 Tax=Shewanella corallii TaxID=560080 RepID=A0ABT0N4R6_9GAMM|nr:hypothetical protein [Shewanella corallii]MCL2913453.1 hypothetical protein [Shewanella corallii]
MPEVTEGLSITRDARSDSLFRILLLTGGVVLAWYLGQFLESVLAGAPLDKTRPYSSGYVSEQAAEIFKYVFYLLALLLLSGSFIPSLYMFIKGGQWHVTVNADGIDWHSPIARYEASFHYPLTDIDCIVDIRLDSGRFVLHEKYLLLKGGRKHPLKSFSGMDIEAIYAELERLGIPVCKTPPPSVQEAKGGES